MNLDDESYLSAYLDDELDPADRLAVEWSVESSPPLGEQLRSLGLARDAVASLERPAIPVDLAPILKARVASYRRKARFQALARPARVALTLSGFSAIAASLIFALILLNYSLHPTEQPILADQPKPEAAPLPHPIDRSHPTPALAPKSIELVAKESTLTPPAVTPPRVNVPPPDMVAMNQAKERNDRRMMARMLDRPHVPRVMIVTDIIDAPNRIKELIHQDARKTSEYGRIVIYQDIVVDPDHAEAAEVFAVPMEERGRRSFVDRLRRIFPDLVEENDSRVDLTSQLPEVGQVAIFRGTRAAPLVDPPLDVQSFIANRTETPADHFVRSPGSVESVPPRNGDIRPTEKAEGSDAVASVDVATNDPEGNPDFVGPPHPYRTSPAKPGDEITLLVWVTRPARR